ncbi:hypothetical protein PABG_05781 [Paracoccidioides brasiliensis Pb03]|nr:hypothetical protein PABG_05781 [Paracoccidioides brasiliensis Pb03]
MSKNSKVTKSKAGLADLTNAGGLADINRQILLRSADDVISPAIPIVFALKEATNWAGNTTCSCRYSLTFPTCIPVTFSSVVEGEAGRNAERIGQLEHSFNTSDEGRKAQKAMRLYGRSSSSQLGSARRNQRAESAILPDIPNVRIFQRNVRTMNDSLNADGITQCRG